MVLAWVSAVALFTGVLILPAVYVLFMNALNVGITGGMMAHAGRLDAFFGYIAPHGILELTAELSDGKIHLRRCAISSFEQCNQIGYEYFVSHAINYVANLARKFEVEIPIKVNAGGEVRV